MATDPDNLLPTIRDDGGSRRGQVSTGDIALPIGNWAVGAVTLSRFLPFLRLHFYGHDGTGKRVGSSGYSLAIEGPMVVVAKGVERRIDPKAGEHPAYLDLVTKIVLRAVASQAGGLVITFTDGDRLEVPPDRYEPWQLEGDDGSLIVSVAGGGLVVWDPDLRKSSAQGPSSSRERPGVAGDRLSAPPRFFWPVSYSMRMPSAMAPSSAWAIFVQALWFESSIAIRSRR
jgi:hypothetical protein